MGAIFSFIIGNPMIILAMIGVFTFTSIGSDVKAWWSERHAVVAAVQPWKQAVADRDEAAAKKDGILAEAINAKIDAEVAIGEIQARFENDEAKRKLDGVTECRWTDNDVRVLNSAIDERPATRH